MLVNEESAKPGEFAQEIRNVKNQIEAIEAERYRGAVVHARVEKLWLHETPTKRALGDEKRYARRNEIKEILYRSTVTRDNKIIEQAFVEYYRDLLGRSAPAEYGFYNEFLSLMPKLEDDTRESLKAPICVGELKKAIDELRPGKIPGPDGLGADFYKMFKTETATALYEVLLEAYEKNRLPPSFVNSHIILINKYDGPV